MYKYIIDFTDSPTPAFLEALRREFGKISLINNSIWMTGGPNRSVRILGHAVATGVRLSLRLSSCEIPTDDGLGLLEHDSKSHRRLVVPGDPADEQESQREHEPGLG